MKKSINTRLITMRSQPNCFEVILMSLILPLMLSFLSLMRLSLASSFMLMLVFSSIMSSRIEHIPKVVSYVVFDDALMLSMMLSKMLHLKLSFKLYLKLSIILSVMLSFHDVILDVVLDVIPDVVLKVVLYFVFNVYIDRPIVHW